ncbi:EAL domain-containing protein [Uliginosibacterium sp. 31-16]|uniref:sensor domain-containing protein n=1 Tax=Uliginosibacterium sp. 31-16 TaxID=3068315 RepID=UPI00273D98A3|nr:EAL domain-containing protein [Uliginosibacterium sp. 31-16]MDP5240956.1 EAL domain-containing protein [Uliginosibacterium sp. 31-16]
MTQAGQDPAVIGGASLGLDSIRTQCLLRGVSRAVCACLPVASASAAQSSADMGFDATRVVGAAILLLLAAVLLYRRQLHELSARTRRLQQSEERFRVIVEGTSVVAWEYDAGSNAFTYVSAPGESLLGFALTDWQQSGFWQSRLHPDDRELALSFLRGLMISGGERECEYRLVHADGHEIHVRDLRGPIEVGHVIGMRGIFVDITAHKASEAALEDSEARFRGTFEQAAVGVCLCAVSGRYMRVNQRYCEITGFSEAELLLRDFREITHPDDIEPNDRLLDALILDTAETFAIEKRMVRRGGDMVWVNLTMSLVRSRRGSGQFMEVIEDITARKQAERELRDNEGRMRTILSAMREGVIMRDATGRVIIANAAAHRLYGLGLDEHFPPLQEPEGYSFVREDGSACPISELPGARAMHFGRPASAVLGIDRRDGTRGWMLAKAEPLQRDEHTGLHPVVLTLNDVTAQRRAEEELRLAATVFDHSVEAIMITDAQRRILSVNKAFTDLTGFAASSVVGQTPALLSASRHGLAYYDSIWKEATEQGAWQGEIWQRRRDGSEFPEWLSIGAVRDRGNAITHYVAVFSDITERKANEARIAFLAHHDPLTALPNRTLFQDRLEQALGRAERSGSMLALLFLDLDRFKTINDSLGHLVGDRLLQSVAERLQHCVRDTDTICRQGGDEFIIVLPEIQDTEAPARIAEKILRRLAEPFEVDSHVLGTSFSIGIAVYPDDGTDADTLMKNADTAMYHAKENGRNTYRFFTETMNANALDRLQVENHLRRALEHNELSLHFQPQVNLHTGAIVGGEALLRWQSDALGFVPPGRFIPIAEESGLIVPIGRWVLREACRLAMSWYENGIRNVTVAVNISALQFRRDDIVACVRDVLAETGLPPEYLELELTESLLMEHVEDVLDTVQRLKTLGVRLSIDDFGTGYSSLSYLKRFAVDRLKIDQGFVRDMVEDPDDAAIVRAIIQLGRSLKLEVIAEGAESRHQVDFLMREGCRESQGYFFCPPVANDVFMDMLARGQASAGQEKLPFTVN